MLGLGRDRRRLVVANGLPRRRRLVHVAATLAEVTGLAAQLAVDVDEVGVHVGHGRAGDQAQLVAALALVLIAVRVHNVAQDAHILAELALVLAIIVGEAVERHGSGCLRLVFYYLIALLKNS